VLKYGIGRVAGIGWRLTLKQPEGVLLQVHGGLAERSIAPGCKPGLNSTVVRIHQPPPNNLGVLAEIGYAPWSRQ
jgi:hypothetical protein